MDRFSFEKKHVRLVVLLLVFMGACSTVGEEYDPPIAKASNEGQAAINTFQLPEGIEAKLFAAEPLVANPVAFTIDHLGRMFVCETFRQEKGVEDNRGHMDWLEDDLAAQTVEDRLAYFKKHLGEEVNSYAKEHDRIRLLEDRNGDGVADYNSVFADGFNGILDGTGSSVLMRDGNLYYTCIPDLWRLRDNDSDGKAEERESLSHGYGVRVAFRGHDSHGLIMGPDGRIYFSIGDRGYNIKTKEGKHLVKPYTGAVFRCELDGSNLEVFATGLRNPQELAFDNHGNLFTCDNNSDGGDQARIVYITRGSDTGWRMYYQYLDDRGPWNREKLWHPSHENQAAYITPPLLNFADGPSGFAHYPGVGLSPRYDDHFFLCDFRGTAGQSGIRSFALESIEGNSFKVVDDHKFIWSILATDFEFGYDGKFYISDWVHGWSGLNKGRVYSFQDKKYSQHEAIKQTQALMSAGYRGLGDDELIGLLKHIDRRVRLEAQFELVRREATNALASVRDNAEAATIPRLHAIWATGQLARKHPSHLALLFPLLDASDQVVAEQAAKTIGENYTQGADTLEAEKYLLKLLPKGGRLSFYAAQSLAALGDANFKDNAKRRNEIANQLVASLAREGDQPFMRHMYSYALSRIADDQSLVALDNGNPRVQLGLIVALRRQQSPRVTELLDGDDDRVILEAARAIHDEPISDAMPALAAISTQRYASPEYGDDTLADPLLRRVVNANFIVGDAASAQRVADIAANPGFTGTIREEAIWALENWNQPPKLNRLLGAYRPIQRQSNVEVGKLIQDRLAMLMNASPDVQKAVIKLAGDSADNDGGAKWMADSLLEFANDTKADGSVRAAAIAALESLNDDRLLETIGNGMRDDAVEVRMQSLTSLAKLQPKAIIQHLTQSIEKGETQEQQHALSILGQVDASDAANRLLRQWVGKLVAGQAPAAIQLDIIEAAKHNETLKDRIAKFDADRPTDGLSRYTECLEGGDAERGAAIFSSRAAVSCRRCHHSTFRSVGPAIPELGKGKERAYLLESIVYPNKQIAKGFETAIIYTNDGLTKTGTVAAETDDIIQLMTPEGDVISIRKDEIDERTTGQSAMPADLVKQLSKRDLRDLVEYLSTVEPVEGEGHE